MQWVIYAGEVRLVRYIFEAGTTSFKAEYLCYAIAANLQATMKGIPLRCMLEQLL